MLEQIVILNSLIDQVTIKITYSQIVLSYYTQLTTQQLSTSPSHFKYLEDKGSE